MVAREDWSLHVVTRYVGQLGKFRTTTKINTQQRKVRHDERTNIVSLASRKLLSSDFSSLFAWLKEKSTMRLTECCSSTIFSFSLLGMLFLLVLCKNDSSHRYATKHVVDDVTDGSLPMTLYYIHTVHTTSNVDERTRVH